MRQVNQAQFMRRFNETHREEFNPDLFKRDNEDLVNGIYQIAKSCERDKYFTLKLLSFTPIYDYEEIYNTLRNHEEKRRKKNSKIENFYDFINIKDTDMILIKMEWLIRHNGLERQEENGVTKEVINPETVMEVLVAIPRFVNKYYFRLSGNYYTTMFQIVDGSTYNNANASQSKTDTVTMKTMFAPVRIFRSVKDMRDIVSGQNMKVIEYGSIIFNTACNAMHYILAAYGMYGASNFLDIDCVTIADTPCPYNDYVCFEKNGIYVSAPKICFQDPMIQSFVCSIIDGIIKNATVQDLFNQRYWLKILGMAFKNATVDKGLFVLDSIDGLYDNITKRDTHLPEEDKENIYTIIRWMLREFSNLRAKENIDVRTKRVRIADYIAQVYATKLNKGMYRISDLGRRVTLKKVEQAIYTQPMFILNSISTMSNLIAYRDMVNDNDATVALKFTYKGISGLGEDGGSIQRVYRQVDPSHIGILDLDSSTTSDPGMTGMICPMAPMYGHSFSQYKEPNEWRENYKPIEDKYKEGTRDPFHYQGEPLKKNYFAERERIVDEELDFNRVRCPFKNVNDPNKTYTVSQAKLDKEEKTGLVSLFDIK